MIKVMIGTKFFDSEKATEQDAINSIATLISKMSVEELKQNFTFIAWEVWS